MLKLQRVGENDNGDILYQDMFGNYYIDEYRQQNPDELMSLCPSKSIDGEPNSPIKGPFNISNPLTDLDQLRLKHEFNLMMVAKYHNDIEAYFAINSCEGNTLDCRYHNEHFICSKSIENCLSSLIEFLNKLPNEIKPAWYSEEVISSYRTLLKYKN